MTSNDSFPDNVAPEFKKKGDDWSATFNPKVERQLGIRLLHTLSHDSTVCCLKFSPDGEYLACACNQAIHIYHARSGEKDCTLVYGTLDTSDDIYIRHICYSPDGKFIVGGGEDKMVRVWNIAERRLINTYQGHTEDVYAVAFTPDGKYVVTGSGDHTTRVWDPTDGSSRTFIIPDVPESVDTGVTGVIISSDQRLVITSGIDSAIRIWDFNTGELLETIRAHEDSVYGLEFTPDERGLVSGSLDTEIKQWDISRFFGDRKDLQDTQSTVNGKDLKGEAGDKSTPLRAFSDNEDYVLTIAFSRENQWLASGSKDCKIQFWDFKTGTLHMVLECHTNAVISVGLSPTENLLATGSGDWQARIWDYSAES